MTENEAIRILGDTTLCTPVGQAAFVGIEAIKKLQLYQQIGTVEECREARERRRAKKPEEYEDKYYACPVCENILLFKWEKYPTIRTDKSKGLPYCLFCGQALDWSDAD